MITEFSSKKEVLNAIAKNSDSIKKASVNLQNDEEIIYFFYIKNRINKLKESAVQLKKTFRPNQIKVADQLIESLEENLVIFALTQDKKVFVTNCNAAIYKAESIIGEQEGWKNQIEIILNLLFSLLGSRHKFIGSTVDHLTELKTCPLYFFSSKPLKKEINNINEVVNVNSSKSLAIHKTESFFLGVSIKCKFKIKAAPFREEEDELKKLVGVNSI